MVGDFSNNVPEFDPITQRIVLKDEHIGAGEIRKNTGNVLIIFDTERVTEEEYPYYFASGLYEIFDIVPI